MKGLLTNDGVWQEDNDKLEAIVESYYHGPFSSIEPTLEMMHDVLKHMGCVISQGMNAKLMRPYTNDDIFEALQ